MVLASTGLGCIGAIGGEDGESAPPDPNETAYATSAFECKPGILPDELPLRRVSNLQYRNVVEDAVRSIVPTHADAVLTEVSSPVNALPRDSRSGPEPKYGGFRRLDQAIFQETVSGAYKVGAEVGKAIVDDPARLTEAAGSCATDADASNDGACIDAFIEKIAPRILRRPITTDDVAFYHAVAGSTLEAEDYADIITVLLSAPSFLYFVEPGVGEPADGAVQLSAHELANRLSFHFWQTGPDDELWALADSGELSKDEVYQAQVERLFSDPRAQRALDEFYGEWLDPQHLGPTSTRFAATSPRPARRASTWSTRSRGWAGTTRSTPPRASTRSSPLTARSPRTRTSRRSTVSPSGTAASRLRSRPSAKA